MACNDCENSNPVTPVYSNAKYVLNGNCADVCTPGIYIPPDSGVEGRTTEVIAGLDMYVEDFSDAEVDRFRVNYNPHIQLTASLAVSPLVSGILQSQPVLEGKTVDEIRLLWSYNVGVIASQTISYDAVVDTIASPDRSIIYTSQTVESDKSYTLDGDDGLGRIGSTAQSIASIVFGNYQIWGNYTRMTNRPVSEVTALIAGLANKNQQIKTTRTNLVFGTGLIIVALLNKLWSNKKKGK